MLRKFMLAMMTQFKNKKGGGYMAVSGDCKIKIIQGDSYTRELYIEGVDPSLIECVYFSCENLNKCCKKLIYDELKGCYLLEFKSSETTDFPQIDTNYDVTVRFTNDKVSTVQYRSQITILPKLNKVMFNG